MIITEIQISITKIILWATNYLIPGDETADGRRDVNCGTDLDRSDECFYHPVISTTTTTTTCDDVERVGGGGEGGRGGNGERGVANHWH